MTIVVHWVKMILITVNFIFFFSLSTKSIGFAYFSDKFAWIRYRYTISLMGIVNNVHQHWRVGGIAMTHIMWGKHEIGSASLEIITPNKNEHKTSRVVQKWKRVSSRTFLSCFILLQFIYSKHACRSAQGKKNRYQLNQVWNT